MNIVTYTGRLTGDNKLEYSQAGTAFLRNTIAVKKTHKKEGEKDDFFRFTAFGKNAENLDKYTHKGSMVGLSGENHVNEYTNKEGQKIRDVVLSVDKIEFLDSKSESGGQNQNDVTNFLNVPDGLVETLPFS
jgi:single-strand DNA-binding protein